MDGSAFPGIVLREYQQTAVADIRGAMQQYRRVLFCLPTGGGKTIIFTFITGQISRRSKRVIILAHRREIVRQISQALTRQGVEHGLILPAKPLTGGAVQVGMVQTLANRLTQVREPDLLICDEAHHSVAGSWDKIKEAWPQAFHLGVTATPQRLDGKGLGHAFDTLIVGPTPSELIALGNLADYEYLAPPSDLDLSGVHTRAGDYASDEAEQALDQSSIFGEVVQHYKKYLIGKPALVFCISVRHATEVAERFRRAGVPAGHVDGGMSQDERDRILTGLENGRIMVVTSCELVSEGFDVPEVQGAILLRPTKSLTLYLQQVGRALRPKRDGSKAIILDHVGNYRLHGFPDETRSWSLAGKDKKEKPPCVTVCKLCFKCLRAPVIHSPSYPCGGIEETPCPFREVKATVGRMIDEVDGELVSRERQPADAGPALSRPLWAQGLALENSQGRDWFRLLDLAGTDPDRLGEIRVARGYKRGWVQHQLAARHELEREVQDFLNGNGLLSELTNSALWLLYRQEKAAGGLARSNLLSRISFEINSRKHQAA